MPPAFGVELPENLGQTSEAGAPESGSSELAPDTKDLGEASKPETTGSRNSGLTDLEKLERFRFEGREWTHKDLRNAYLRHQDYTRKTQEVAEARKFADNFEHDLNTVLQSPERLQELKSLYPESYWKIAERILEARGKVTESPAAKPESTQAPQTPRELQELMAWKNQVQAEQTEHRVQFIQNKLDQDFEKFGKQYDFADPETVNSRALAWVEANPKNQLTPKVLEALFKQHHEQAKTRYEKYYGNKVEQQKRAGFKAKDAGPGGSTPGAAPKRPKTITEAKQQWLSDLEAAR
jgi:hypothetical protein